jgi:predicted nucleic acid-binding Zn ribbon protein
MSAFANGTTTTGGPARVDDANRLERAVTAPARACEVCDAEHARRSVYCSDRCTATARRRRAYGLTTSEYRALLDHQRGRCAICDRLPRTRPLHVDHDHRTGLVRGLLCSRCNHDLLGAAHERPDLLRAAAWYLDEPPAPRVLNGPRFTPTVPARKPRFKVRAR